MYELILSNIKTGRVSRRAFETREEADRYFDRFLDNPSGLRPRNRRDYRAEVYHRPLPAMHPTAALMEEAA